MPVAVRAGSTTIPAADHEVIRSNVDRPQVDHRFDAVRWSRWLADRRDDLDGRARR